MPFFQDESESHLKNSTTDISDSADYQWNAASAQGFLTAVVRALWRFLHRSSCAASCWLAEVRLQTDGKHILQLSTILYAR